jgi:hypothetical protein
MVNEQLIGFPGEVMKRLMVAILAGGLAGGMLVAAAAAADVDGALDLPLRSTLSTAIGYDSNPEDVVDPDSGYFHEQKATVSFEKEADGFTLDASANAELRGYGGNTDADSWSYGADASAGYQVTNDIAIGVAASHEQEDDQGDKSNTQNVSGFVSQDTDFIATKLGLSLDRNDDADNQFDHMNFGVEQDFSLWPKNAFSPFLHTAFKNIHHPEQDYAPVNRNARDGKFVAGMRYRHDNVAQVLLGGSFAYRNFNAAGTQSHSGFGIEAETSWTPWDFIELSSGARRRFKSTDVEGSLVADVHEVDAAVKIKASDYVTYKSRLSMEGTKEIGADQKSLNIELKNRATYTAFEHLDLFAEFNKEWEKTIYTADGTSEKTSSITALLGVEASF